MDEHLDAAIAEAQAGLSEGGIPIGSEEMAAIAGK